MARGVGAIFPGRVVADFFQFTWTEYPGKESNSMMSLHRRKITDLSGGSADSAVSNILIVTARTLLMKGRSAMTHRMDAPLTSNFQMPVCRIKVVIQ